MKFNIYVTLTGPGGRQELPNKNNPVESPDLATALRRLSEVLPLQFGYDFITAVRIERTDDAQG